MSEPDPASRQDDPVRQTVEIVHEVGLHAHPAATLTGMLRASEDAESAPAE